MYDIKVDLPKIITSENSGAATIDPLSFVLHQIHFCIVSYFFSETDMIYIQYKFHVLFYVNSFNRNVEKYLALCLFLQCGIMHYGTTL